MEIISRSISTKVWDRAGIELGTLGSAVKHITDCAMQLRLCSWVACIANSMDPDQTAPLGAV